MLRHLRAWMLRLVGSVRRARGDEDLADELASHLQLHIDDNLRASMSPDEARRQALLKLGGVTQTKEAHRDRRGLPWLDSLARDVKYAVRFLRRSPGFTAVAILSLALGIGANTAIFSVIDALLLRSLPVEQPSRLVQLRTVTAPEDGRSWWSNPVWEQVHDRADLFAGVCAFGPRSFNLSPSGELQQVAGLMVSGRFFDVLGVRPILGRGLTTDDDRINGGKDGPVAVISYAFWQSAYHGAADVIGRRLVLNNVSFTVVGVMPQGFLGPLVGSRADIAVPLGTQPLLDGFNELNARGASSLAIMARLKPGQTVAQASASLRTAQVAIRQATLPPGLRPQDAAGYLEAPFQWRSAATGIASPVRDRYAAPILAIMAIAGLVLLIACVNLANLLLARAATRRHELAIRRALGASRGRLIQQLFLEALLLALAGALVALVFATWSSRILLTQVSAFGTPTYLDLSLNLTVFAFTLGVAFLVAVGFGTAPAIRATRFRMNDALANHRRTGEPRRRRGPSPLVTSQVALCLALVIGAGLFLRTFLTLERLNPGFDERPVLVVDIKTRGFRVISASARQAVAQAVSAAPGVRAAAWSLMTPLNGMSYGTLIENPEGRSLPESDRRILVNAIGPGWLSVMGTPLLAGRGFSAQDASGPPVAIVDEAFSKEFFAGESPLGRTIQRVQRPGKPTQPITIVGVASDAVYSSLRAPERATVYTPLDPEVLDRRFVPQLTLCVRTSHGSADGIVRDVSAAISRADSDLSFSFHTMDDLADESLASERMLAMLSAFFGALALLLAAIGLYGVVSYSVNRRRTEIGIRMALGAKPGGIVRMMLGRIGVTMTIGLAVGGVLSVWLASFVKSLLYGLQPDDPLTLAGAVAVLALVGLLAAWIPARRAARIDPMEALREN